jgi:HSP90 family molecular chaperone
MEPFKDQDTPIIFIYMHIDEMVFKGVQKYQNFSFVNIETNQDELKKTIKEVEHDFSKGLP